MPESITEPSSRNKRWPKIIQPFLWLWLIAAVVLMFAGDRIVSPGWSERGYLLLGAYFAFGAVAIVASKPERCSHGHTDIGFYYGRWSCRTCFKQRRRVSSQ